MPVISKFPSSNQAAGSPFNGSWTSPNNAHADDGVYATAAPGKNQEFASVWSVPFATGDIADGSTVNSVTVEVQWKVSTNASVATLRSSAFADSAQVTTVSASPGVNDAAEPTADTVRTYTATPTLAELRDLWIRAQAMRGNTNTAFTASLDYIKVTVDYTAGPAAISGSGGVSFGLATSGAGTAALPAVSGTGGVSFGIATSASGTVEVPIFSGSGAVAFGIATSGSGTYVPAAIAGSGGVTFGFVVSGTGSTSNIVPIGGTGSVAFGFSTAADGTVTQPVFAGSGGVAFGFAAAGSGTYAEPVASDVTGTGGVIFGIAADGIGFYTAPVGDEPTLPHIDPDGPWIHEGTIHLGRRPNH